MVDADLTVTNLLEVIDKHLLHLEHAHTRSLREQFKLLEDEIQSIFLSYESRCIKQYNDSEQLSMVAPLEETRQSVLYSTAVKSTCMVQDFPNITPSKTPSLSEECQGVTATSQIWWQEADPDLEAEVPEEPSPEIDVSAVQCREQVQRTSCELVEGSSDEAIIMQGSADSALRRISLGSGISYKSWNTEVTMATMANRRTTKKEESLKVALAQAAENSLAHVTEGLYSTHILRKEWVHHLACVLESSISRNSTVSNQYMASLVFLEPRAIFLADRSRDDTFMSCVQWLVLSPVSLRRLWWDVVAMILTVYDLTVLPLAFFSFQENDFSESMFWLTVIFWSLDLILSFFTGVQVEAGIEMRPSRIAAIYIRGWFSVDLVIILPDWILAILTLFGLAESGGLHRFGRIAKVMRFVRSVRLLRIFRFTRALTGVQDRLKSEFLLNVFDFGKLVGGVAILNHYLSCIWFGIGTMGEQEGWVHTFEMQSSPKEYQYLTSLHWSISQFHGTMEVQPGTSYERLYAIGTAFLGLISASLFISSITNLVLRFQKLHQETFMNTRKLLRYLSENHVSPDLTVRIKLFAKRATGAAIMTAEDVDILKTLPSHLLQELNIEIKSLTLHMNIVLKRIVYKLPHAKHQLCLDAITEAHVNSSGLVFGYLEKSNQMFIISKGKVMYHPSPARQASLTAVEQSNNSYLQPERLSMADARSSASHRSSVDSSLNPPRVSSSSDREELSGDARRDNPRVSKDSKQNLLGLPKTFSRTFSIQNIFKASRADTGEIVVEAGRSIAEMNIWTEWQHQGDCMLAGSASIFSVKVDAFTKVLSSENYHNVGLALDISHYSNHYLQWLNSSSDQGHQINDLSYAPNLVMDHESSLVSAMRRMGQHMRPGHIFRR